MRIPYHCPYCYHSSTRRWNLQIHIKRKHGGPPDPYLASQPSHQFSYEPTNPSHNIESPVGYSFQPRYDLQQAPVGITQYSAGAIYPPWQTIDDQSHGRGLSPEPILKIGQLKGLVYKYPQYQNNDPDGIIRWAIYNSINGDDTLLDNKLEQLRTLDSIAKYYDS